MANTIAHFIGGGTYDGGVRRGPLFNPSSGAQTGECLFADRETVSRAVETAAAAGRDWGRAPHAARLQVMFKMRELVMRDLDKLAVGLGREHGKTIADAKGEIVRSLEALEFATNAPHLMKGEYSRNVGGGIDAFSVSEPLGVVACVSPFNFPVMVPLMMGSMAVATGNAVISKPSEKVPASALALAKLWQEAGLPDGVWSVVQGDRETVDVLLEHRGIAAVTFVGSTAVGEYVHRTASVNGKRVACYTGGKNHMVVMPDADLEAAADAFISAGFGSASQRCMAISLLLPVGAETAGRMREMLVPKVRALKVGAYDDPHADFGALVSAESKGAVEDATNACVQSGAEVVVDGRGVRVAQHPEGFYFGATLLDRVTPQMDFYQKEVFGPVRGIVHSASLDEAMAITNSHEYGNGAVIYTSSGHSANRFVSEVEAGAIGVNVAVPVPAGYFNFGGFRRSRFGDAYLFGPDAARFFTKTKTVSQKWPGVDLAVAKTNLAFAPNT